MYSLDRRKEGMRQQSVGHETESSATVGMEAALPRDWVPGNRRQKVHSVGYEKAVGLAPVHPLSP